MPDRITSLQNQRVKDAVRLRDRHGRDDQQRIVIDGAREIARAIEAGVKVVELYASLDALADPEQKVIDQAAQAGAQILDVTQPVMTKLAYGDRGTGLVAVARTPKRTLNDVALSADAVVGVLERVEKPGNIGAVVRTADSAGVSAILIADGGTDLFNPNAIRASAGTIFSLPVIATTAAEAMRWLHAGGFRIFATQVTAETRYWDASFMGRVAIVLGSETSGLSAAWSGSGVQAITIPQRGVADSLNVSVTAAVIFYEAVRQRASHGR